MWAARFACLHGPLKIERARDVFRYLAFVSKKRLLAFIGCLHRNLHCSMHACGAACASVGVGLSVPASSSASPSSSATLSARVALQELGVCLGLVLA